jgi:UDP-glucose 4-epimerase
MSPAVNLENSCKKTAKSYRKSFCARPTIPAVSFNRRVFAGANVLVTGGLGFIGSSLARRLVALRAKVTLVDSLIPEYGGNLFNIHDIRSQVTVDLTDVRDAPAMAALIKGRSFLFNLAGQTSHLDSMTDPLTDLNINAAAQLSILEACRLHNRDVKIIFASTRQLYGRPQYLPVDEKHPINPIDVNGVNKLAGEWYHLLYNNVYKIRACALRLTNTYGPGMRVKDARQTFLGIWIRHIIEGKPIQVFGDGRQRRDFNFIDDVIEALLFAAAAPTSEGQVFNLGHSEHISLQDLAALLVRLNGGGNYQLIPFPADRATIDIGNYYGDFRKIENALGWAPRISLEDGLTRTLKYYRRYHAHYWNSQQ